jgi:L-threonylcarbamoyladenylate synthase
METLGEVEIDPALGGGAGYIPRAPGMKYTHYAPLAPMVLFEGEYPKIADLIVQETRTALAAGKKVGAIVSKETAERLSSEVVSVVYGSREQVGQFAANLYTALRSYDENPVEIIFAEGIPEDGLGLAVMNRLRKASSYQIVKATEKNK